MQSFEGVKKFILSLFLINHKLHIVHQQNIGAPIKSPKFIKTAAPGSSHVIIRKPFEIKIQYSEILKFIFDDVPNGLQKMGLAQPDVTIKKQRIITRPGFFGNSLAGRTSQLIAGADDKSGKNVTRIKRDLAGGRKSARRLSFCNQYRRLFRL